MELVQPQETLEFDPSLLGSRQQVEDPEHPACWCATHLGMIHATELQLFDQVTDLANRIYAELMTQGEELADARVTTKNGFVRDLGMFLLAWGRRGELGEAVCDGTRRFGERVFPAGIAEKIRCSVVKVVVGLPE